MENNEERVLAYNLSKIINQDDLESVSGGARVSQHLSGCASAGSGQGRQANLDVVWDL